MTSSLAYIALNLTPKIGPIKANQILHHLGDAPQIFSTPKSLLTKIPGIGSTIAANLLNPATLTKAQQELEECEKRGLKIITQKDANYPQSLKPYPDSPLLLYVWGELSEKDQHSIAIVGTRAATPYGKQTTREISTQLSQAGYSIISGLARGIDSYAHQAAVEAGGRTIAVLGSGLAQLYPPENLKLAQKIADGHGAIISEFPLHAPPDRQFFPMRNRIVASWASSLIVTESPKKSGSLITANMAAEKGKNVYAVPGPINRPHSSGCHQLIREGATLLTCASELLEDEDLFPSERKQYQKALPENTSELRFKPQKDTTSTCPIIDILATPSSAEEIAAQLDTSIEDILTQLTELELEGKVEIDSSGLFIKSN